MVLPLSQSEEEEKPAVAVAGWPLLNMEVDEEYTALMKDMQYALEQVRASKFFADLTNQIQENPEMVSKFKGGPMVVYGFGSIQYNYAAKLQLSLALLLREVVGLEIQHDRITICCDDITLTPTEEKVMKAYGCHVALVTGGRFRWTVVVDDDEPTLFFLPFTRPEVLGDLLHMNWCPSQLERMLILGRSFKSIAKTLDPVISRCNNNNSEEGGGHAKMTVKKLSYAMDRLRYIWGIKEHTEQFKITNTSSSESESQDCNPHEEVFHNLCWHEFNTNRLKIIHDLDTLLPSAEACFKWVGNDERYPYRMDEEDVKELVKLRHEMEITKLELRDSTHYHKLRDQLEEDHVLQTEISRRLGFEEDVQMIIYALGSLEYSFASQYQFALALLMREDIAMLRIGKIEVFDPCITPVDANLIQSFGCNVLSVNEFARRKVDKPTLFFLPCAPYNLVANLLEVNWVHSKLENLIILGTSMHHWATMKEQPDPPEPEYDELEGLCINDRLRYMRAIYDFSVNIAINDEGSEGHEWCWPLKNLHWIFFNLHPGININSFLPSFPTLKKIQVDHAFSYLYLEEDLISDLRNSSEEVYCELFMPDREWKDKLDCKKTSRAPCKYRKAWSQPQQGWIKLNFDSYRDGHGNYGYGGVLRNSNGETLFSYAGSMRNNTNDIENDNDDIAMLAAQVEGLRQGIICFKKWLPNSAYSTDPNLLIEGSMISVIRWAIALLPPPTMFVDAFKEMCIMLDQISCMVHHIYPGANIEANQLAQHGVTLFQLTTWT